jgi:hypothetical protein
VEFGHLYLVLTLTGDNLRPVKKLGKIHRPYADGNVITRSGFNIILLHFGRGVESVVLHSRAAATTSEQKDK